MKFKTGIAIEYDGQTWMSMRDVLRLLIAIESMGVDHPAVKTAIKGVLEEINEHGY